MVELNKRKKEFLKAYNNLCSCYGDIISEQTKVSCNILAEKVKLQQQLAIAVEENKLLKRKLAIAIQAMDVETLKQIKELEK